MSGTSNAVNETTAQLAAETKGRVHGKSAIVGNRGRLGLIVTLSIRMMFHDKLKLAGTLFGVVFAVFLAAQGTTVFNALVTKNRSFVENAGADVWISAKGTEALVPTDTISLSALTRARVTPGVAHAEPLLYGAGAIRTPDGRSEAITLIGTKPPRFLGGPWNMVVGSPDVLEQPDVVVLEDSQRERYGGVNLGSIRELSGHRVVVGGFSWGLLPFGPAFGFAELETARAILGTPIDRVHHVLVKIEDGYTGEQVRDALKKRIPELTVMTKDDFRGSILNYLLKNTQIAISLGTSSVFAIIVGFFIVALSMFSSVIDNIREFGTLKAIGATMWDLTRLLFVQSMLYATIGTTIGLFLATRLGEKIRSPMQQWVYPEWLWGGAFMMMIVICSLASIMALLRIRKVEPGMVFR